MIYFGHQIKCYYYPIIIHSFTGKKDLKKDRKAATIVNKQEIKGYFKRDIYNNLHKLKINAIIIQSSVIELIRCSCVQLHFCHLKRKLFPFSCQKPLKYQSSSECFCVKRRLIYCKLIISHSNKCQNISKTLEKERDQQIYVETTP